MPEACAGFLCAARDRRLTHGPDPHFPAPRHTHVEHGQTWPRGPCLLCTPLQTPQPHFCSFHCFCQPVTCASPRTGVDTPGSQTRVSSRRLRLGPRGTTADRNRSSHLDSGGAGALQGTSLGCWRAAAPAHRGLCPRFCLLTLRDWTRASPLWDKSLFLWCRLDMQQSLRENPAEPSLSLALVALVAFSSYSPSLHFNKCHRKTWGRGGGATCFPGEDRQDGAPSLRSFKPGIVSHSCCLRLVVSWGCVHCSPG